MPATRNQANADPTGGWATLGHSDRASVTSKPARKRRFAAYLSYPYAFCAARATLARGLRLQNGETAKSRQKPFSGEIMDSVIGIMRLVKWIALAARLATLPAGTFAAAEELRTWTNRASTRQAEARLVRVDGGEIRLQSAAGVALRTRIDELSERDRVYVRQFVSKTSAAAGAMPVVRSLLNNLPGVPGAVAQLTDTSGSDDLAGAGSAGILAPLMRPLPKQLPAELVHVRLSKAFLEEFIEGDVQREQVIQDRILGTRISGNARTSGTTTLILHASQEKAIAEVVVTGAVHAHTVGHNGPVRLHCTSQTPFESRKFVYFGPDGIQALATRSTARTRSHTTQIDAMLPGLRGRIAERVAWNRADQLKYQADAIASRHTEQRLNAEFDRSVEHSIAEAQAVLLGKLDQLPTQGAELPTNVTYRSTPEYLEIVLSNSDANGGRDTAQPVYQQSAKIAVRVHRAVLRSAMTDPQMRLALRPLLIGLSLGGKPTPVVQPASAPVRKSPEFYVSWSADQEWLEIDFARTQKPPVPVNAVVAGGTGAPSRPVTRAPGVRRDITRLLPWTWTRSKPIRS